MRAGPLGSARKPFRGPVPEFLANLAHPSTDTLLTRAAEISECHMISVYDAAYAAGADEGGHRLVSCASRGPRPQGPIGPMPGCYCQSGTAASLGRITCWATALAGRISGPSQSSSCPTSLPHRLFCT